MLSSLDAEVLEQHRCYFGGGTAMSLRYGEYRESLDIDFLIADRELFRNMRLLTGGPHGMDPLVRSACKLDTLREIRIDKYGIRTFISSEGMAIKFEIILEDRIALDPPGPADRICGISMLNPIDMAAEKLLANCGRWADEAICRRDVIDLAMQGLAPRELKRACEKAEEDYGAAVRHAFHKALDHIRAHPDVVKRCMTAMKMDTLTHAELLQKLRKLQRRLPNPQPGPS